MGRIRVFATLIGLAGLGMATMNYTATVEEWRKKREASLKAEGGWLTLAGLVWLHDGANTVGSDAKADVRLARGPARLGVIEYHAGKAVFHAAPGAGVSFNGPMKSDADEAKPDVVRFQDISFLVIHRGQRDAVRVKDTRSDAMQTFKGLHWYRVKEEYHVVAKWTPYNPPRMLAVPNILGETEHNPSPGVAVFTLQGKELRLEPTVEDGTLFFVFRDQTAGKETYPSGRFLHSAMPEGGKVVLDFNEAYNPPCAFTPYATCPLPTPQNRMPIRIEAGELNYGHHGG